MSDVPAPPVPAIRRLALPEFTAMLAMLFATIAFSIDAMLPALPQIAADLSPDAPNRAQLILSAFVLGMGTGTLFAGPLSDAFGRKPVIAAGLIVYICAALLAREADSLEFLLAARFLQGLGASGPRIAGVALSRDLYEGREMARVMSFVMMVFMVVPALAPMIGAGVIAISSWHGIFLAFAAFGLIAISWVSIRQPETLHADARRPLQGAVILDGLKQVLRSREVRLYTFVMTLGFGQMFALLSSIQQIFDQTYGKAESFPYWFALIAAFSATASFINGRLVGRLGMRKLVLAAYFGQFLLSAFMVALFLSGAGSFLAFYIWATSVFFIAGFTFGNLNALAMQTMGHVAGMATSVIAAISTVLAVAIAGPVGLAFDGTSVPAMIGAALCSGLAYLLMRRA
ncbi:multidrug effflux MFS transporter [Frigidibacter sp. RF13]|uniref:multidrug effflux MFS transporter n=1 Tax=Frigidibacter sp. RF13 TaxID=2997340 RepID=UPI002271557D|nr:multidrug effflux MFS transporter [Frigidibacter sp. RF13]MCY1125328.1 multidrug effflux MFS transporter [Frigidibacter sp. RF13]